MEIPDLDLTQLKKDQERNFQERLKFIDLYVEWLQRTPNKIWSTQHKEFIDAQFLRK